MLRWRWCAQVRTRCVALSPTGRSWSAATTEGLLLYSVDDALVFDPTDLAEDVTPAAALKVRAVEGSAIAACCLSAIQFPDTVSTQVRESIGL